MNSIQRRNCARSAEPGAGAKAAAGYSSAIRMQIAADSVIELPSGKVRAGTRPSGLILRKASSGGPRFTSTLVNGAPAIESAASATKLPEPARPWSVYMIVSPSDFSAM